ncbi:ATPase inhibitor [Penicillium taxi]|uniref:ATPase inhibitor n=1 Tax=Penicillium taxi TaxID=168475 RepID=UPI00254590A7|nr:ATPase inhibitor [Penicillium taxi]KAJ5888593.1 ATPase inhibitor [Penicillium taxi]
MPLTRPILRITTTSASVLSRSFCATPLTMAAGDTGAPKARGFLAEKDQFARREAAQEGLYIRKAELEKIERLRAKLKEQRKHMDELDKHLEEFAKSQGGEQN